MGKMVDKIQFFFEQYAFGVCARLGEKLGIATSNIRLFFIYASFLTFGSPVLIYLALAFVMNIRKAMRKRDPIWYY
jgi:phage shock protein PspC (stress-responsive transcriptional regulator)